MKKVCRCIKRSVDAFEGVRAVVVSLFDSKGAFVVWGSLVLDEGVTVHHDVTDAEGRELPAIAAGSLLALLLLDSMHVWYYGMAERGPKFRPCLGIGRRGRLTQGRGEGALPNIRPNGVLMRER